MATTTLAAPKKKKTRSLVLRLFQAAAIVVVATLLGLALWIGWIGRHELPQVDGTITVAGITGPVSVVRDKLGVPHIRATSYDDLFFAQGFVTAQDRLWQMDISRRYAAGNLAELLGPALLKHDRQQRYLQIRAACESAVTRLDGQQRNALEAYARGVNAFIEQSREHLPLEFKILRYSPALWRIEDSLLIGANMDQMLNTQYELELKREKVVRHLNVQEIADLYPTTSWRDLPPAQQANPAMEDEQQPAKRNPGSEREQDDE